MTTRIALDDGTTYEVAKGDSVVNTQALLTSIRVESVYPICEICGRVLTSAIKSRSKTRLLCPSNQLDQCHHTFTQQVVAANIAMKRPRHGRPTE